MELLGNIYSWFESFFGLNLAQYLWGYNCDAQDFTGNNLYNPIGLITLGVSFLFVFAYYYLPLPLFNHPRFNRWWNWLIILLFAGGINFFIAYAWTINDFLSGNIGDCLMYSRDEQGNIISQHIFESDCSLFGLSNFFVSTMFFIGWSVLLKWGSRNCKHSPV